ncbi:MULTISPECIES: Rieske 2Fe-2S domain-containing protein [unclassified Paraburkholderia]|uniref:Rieske 2Fe-2S domain-containing protein n=1 Tax=unclassified Paraburkholderia TaxID=2615204 RepID=UPI00197CBD4E|nr:MULTISPECIES: Rieske 2Fe-2S domain-containing protein [unclassified Paraburkholderia]MBN3857138.1 Rieske (2Fe-2S) protein [Paraburkholderia sp. Ac-20340]
MDWSRVCASDEVAAGTARAVTLGALRLVVWRDGEGDVHVWDDRCPHRGDPLSGGDVSGGLLTCPSHGWRFDVNGQQVRMLTVASQRTASQRCTSANDATVHPARESDGFVWACIDALSATPA